MVVERAPVCRSFDETMITPYIDIRACVYKNNWKRQGCKIVCLQIRNFCGSGLCTVPENYLGVVLNIRFIF